MHQYQCGDCHKPVTREEKNGEIVFVRECGHTEAAVLANMEAVVYGESKTE
jgi:hypothetical protein